MELRVAHVVPCTEAEGPGKRFAIWVQGCSLRCAGCCNPEMFGREGGRAVEVESLAREIVETAGIEGVSFLGGEPLEQAGAVAAIAKRAREAGLSVMIFSGYTRAEIDGLGDDARAAIEASDLLVDGRYDRTLSESRRRWIGSRNQAMHFLTDRYRADDPRFVASNTIEIRLRRGEISVNGWPSGSRVLEPRK